MLGSKLKLNHSLCISLFAGSFAHPETPPHSATSSAISRYGDYLEGMYSRSSVSSDGKFPPTPSKTYVNLAVVEHSGEVCDSEQMRENTLHGRVDEMLEGKTKIETADIIKPLTDSTPVPLAFVEGPPGIGKSTLAWELCRKWDRKQYDLAVLLRLREREVQQIKSVADLFPHFDQDLQKSVAKDMLYREGKGVLFILDGYDELPVELRCTGLLLKLIKGEVFSKCSVLVTSRPSATKDLFKACRPLIKRHVEILGFTQKSVRDYASSIFSAAPEVLEDFLTYISASKNPAINSLMYIPLNAAIIVEIYKNSRRKGCPIPKTMTQVYTQLCLTLIQRHIESTESDLQDLIIMNFSDLPSTNYHSHLKNLSRLAFEQFVQHNIVFYSSDVPKELVHFGLLDSVPALYGGGGVSYNFLHLTLQEFLAAYHITQLSNGIDVFKCYAEDGRWEVVWRFVSGLTSFQYFKDSMQNKAFYTMNETGDIAKVKNLLLHCLFESQKSISSSVVSSKNVYFPLDRYALGYCIANSSSTTWDVELRDGSDKGFMWGLNTNPSTTSNGNIIHLSLLDFKNYYLTAYSERILHCISFLKITSCSLFSLVEGIPLMKNLEELSIPIDSSDIGGTVLQTISFSNVTSLTLYCTEHPYEGFLTSIASLVSSTSRKLKNLTITGCVLLDVKPLCEILFGLSCLNQLSIHSLMGISGDCFSLLQTNACLTSVHLEGRIQVFPAFSIILQSNKTLQKIYLGIEIRVWPRICKLLDLEQVENFNAALATNTTLKEFTLSIRHEIEDQAHVQKLSSLIHDSRVKIYSCVTKHHQNF